MTIHNQCFKIYNKYNMIPRKPLPPRDLKTLYKMVLYNLELHNSYGICTAILTTKEKGWISKEEYKKLNDDLLERKPAGKLKSEYWFKDKEERIVFLNILIDSL